jgi:hypothetical protein
MSGKYDPEISNIFQLQEQENRNTRGHKYKLFKPRCRLNIRKNSFCNRVVNMWNSLSENVVTANTLLTFERRLRTRPILGKSRSILVLQLSCRNHHRTGQFSIRF